MKFIVTLLLLFIYSANYGQLLENQEPGKPRSLPKSPAGYKYNTDMDNYDITYYGLDLEATISNNFISGSVIVKARAKSEPMSKFVIQLINQFSVSSVQLNGVSVPFSHLADEISVNTTPSIPAGEYFTVKIFYSGNAGEGLTCSRSTWGNYVTWSLSESFHAYEWFPVKQSLTDKADSVDVFVTVPSYLEVASNGLLKKTVLLTNNKKRYEWQSRYPIDYYLISITIADYIEYDTFANPVGMASPLIIQNFVYNISGCLDSYKSVIDQTDEMIELYSNLFGTYPFAKEKYGHVMAPFGGGMEHQTITTVGYFSTGLVAHELAHMWFGDYVTCATWQDIWINEGFASYVEYLQLQNQVNQYSADGWMNDAQSRALLSPNGSVYINSAEATDENRIFSYNLSYKKGAAIIHMLRYEINNDQLFFEILREYLIRYGHSTATGEDFKTVVNDLTSKDFAWFFDQWYYGYGYPEFSFQYGYSDNHSWVTITQSPSNIQTPLFRTSMELKLNHQNSTTTQRVFISENPQTFTFDTPPITSITPDPDKWILKRIGTISSDNIIGKDDFWVTIGPNPFSDNITISLNTNFVGNYDFTLYDMSGKLLLQQKVAKNTQTINLSGIAKGIYLVKIANGQKSTLRKLVKE